jgi:hypothetical protein
VGLMTSHVHDAPGDTRTFKSDIKLQVSEKNAEDGVAAGEGVPSSFHDTVSPDDDDPAKCV